MFLVYFTDYDFADHLCILPSLEDAEAFKNAYKLVWQAHRNAQDEAHAEFKHELDLIPRPAPKPPYSAKDIKRNPDPVSRKIANTNWLQICNDHNAAVDEYMLKTADITKKTNQFASERFLFNINKLYINNKFRMFLTDLFDGPAHKIHHYDMLQIEEVPSVG